MTPEPQGRVSLRGLPLSSGQGRARGDLRASARRRLGTLARHGLAVLALAGLGTGAFAFERGDAEAGRRLYRDGVLASGEPLKAQRPGGPASSGREAACMPCHKASGFGGTEGISFVPPITARHLRAPGRPPEGSRVRTAAGIHREPFRAHRRPAYDAASLHRALVAGVDSDGRPLGELMPRYALSPQQVDDLAAYLTRLSRHATPGVERDVVHLATVVTGDVTAERRASFERVLRGCLEAGAPPAANARAADDRQAERSRPSAGARVRAITAMPSRWRLSVWPLQGAPATWPAQLQAHARRRPVMAIVSGLAPRAFGPVQAFCEDRRIPCVLPETAAVDAARPSDWTFHFSRAVSQEAALAEEDLRERLTGDPTTRVLQWIDGSEASDIAARTLQQRLSDAAVQVQTLRWPDDAERGVALIAALRPGDVVAAWLDAASLQTFMQQPAPAAEVVRYASSTLAGWDGLPALPPAWTEGLRVLHPYDEPSRALRRLAHNARAWLPAGPVDAHEVRTTAHALSACEVAGRALRQMSREWPAPPLRLLEHVETAEEAATATAFPRFTLGPGQRVGSRGGWVLRVEGGEPRQLVPLGDWRVPDWSSLADARPESPALR